MRAHPGTFVAGILFMAIGAVYALEAFDVWTVRPARLWPVALIAIGIVVLFSGRTQARRPITATEETPQLLAEPDDEPDGGEA